MNVALGNFATCAAKSCFWYIPIGWFGGFNRMKSNWIAWGVTLGEGILLLGAGVVLGAYWLMLPVWMRSCAGFGLGLAFVAVGFRFYRFQRKQRRAVETPVQAPRDEVSVRC